MGWLWGREWPWILLSFLLGAILTWLWMVHKVRRELPRARARTDRDVRTDRDADRDVRSDRDAGRDARSGGAATAVGAGAAGAGVVGAKRADAERATDKREEVTKREDVAKREDARADTTAPQPTAAAAAAPVAKKADADRPAPAAKATPARTPSPDIRKSTAKKRDTELYDQEADADRPGASSGGASMTGTAAAGTAAAAGAAAVGRHEAHDDRDENADKTIRGDQHDAPTEAVPVVPRHEKDPVDHDAPTGEIPVARAHPDRERGAGEQATAGSATDVPAEPATQAPTTAAPAAAAAAASADARPTTPSAAAARAGSGSSRGHDAARRVADEQDPMVARFGAGAASPKEDGSAPSSEYVIKGNADSMLFHTQDSPRYEATRPEVWFKDEAAATGAGFAHWDRKKRRTGRSGSPSGPAADAPKDASTASGTAALAAEPATAPAAQPTEAPAAEPDPMTEQFGPAAASPKEGGAPPSDEYTVKGNSDSMLFHTSDSPGFRATVAEVWFKDEESARAAGFRHWDHRRR
ncbi:channel accessory protein ArfC [Luteipulveratus flavus]|uniref:LapA family protein n=1 Tax=Luteipulveratus flavus TaxID=3031728 RepID=A0ABT6CA41_9MICO|nr:LapA family protein [Luteipulveratus sp. YIM 133296]MDF8265771.1 LapA family protein [Luteipulveratus sp. YIM 133296]